MANSNKIHPEQIEKLIGAAEIEEQVFFDKVLVACYKLPNGFVLVGHGACVDPDNFDIEIGRKVAQEQVENELWKLEGYVLQNSDPFPEFNG